MCSGFNRALTNDLRTQFTPSEHLPVYEKLNNSSRLWPHPEAKGVWEITGLGILKRCIPAGGVAFSWKH